MPISRVFVGIGWKASTKVDVDCVCAPYSNGVRAETDTVGFFNLNSTISKRKGKDYCHIKHSGDVLIGQEGKNDLEDLERIYVDLENMPVKYDCLAFEANVFTPNMTFSALDEC